MRAVADTHVTFTFVGASIVEGAIGRILEPQSGLTQNRDDIIPRCAAEFQSSPYLKTSIGSSAKQG